MKRLILYISLLLVLYNTSTISSYALGRNVNSIYLEFAGVAGNYSLNYDRILRNLTSWVYWTAGGGLSVCLSTVINLSFHASLLHGIKAHNLEAGAGNMPGIYLYKNGNDQSQMLNLFLVIGLRNLIVKCE